MPSAREGPPLMSMSPDTMTAAVEPGFPRRRHSLSSLKSYGPKQYISPAKPRPSITTRLRRLVERTVIRGLGVDFIKGSTDGTFWAVDLNHAAEYRNTGLETALCTSILSCLREHDRDG